MNNDEIYALIGQLTKQAEKLPLGSMKRANIEWQIKKLLEKLEEKPPNSTEGFK